MKKETLFRISMIIIIISIIIALYPNYDYMTNHTAKLVSIVSSLFIGATPIYYKNIILFNFGTITPMLISSECSGLIAISVFLIVVLLVPKASIKSRIYSFSLAPVIYLSNIIRLVAAVVIGDKFGADYVILYHSTVGQVFMFVILVTCFIGFVKINQIGGNNENIHI